MGRRLPCPLLRRKLRAAFGCFLLGPLGVLSRVHQSQPLGFHFQRPFRGPHGLHRPGCICVVPGVLPLGLDGFLHSLTRFFPRLRARR
jgi:hypothetical protein